jgi:hypothetical protein
VTNLGYASAACMIAALALTVADGRRLQRNTSAFTPA